MIDSKKVPLTSQASGVRVDMVAHHVQMTLDAVGAQIRWDVDKMVQVLVTESLWNRTAGLCGNVNGKVEDDLVPPGSKGSVPLKTFVMKNMENGLGGRCQDEPNEKPGCVLQPARAPLAKKYCQQLLTDKKFVECKTKVDVKAILEACEWDYCACGEDDGMKCACNTIDMFVRECRHKGVKLPHNWRDGKTCRKYY